MDIITIFLPTETDNNTPRKIKKAQKKYEKQKKKDEKRVAKLKQKSNMK